MIRIHTVLNSTRYAQTWWYPDDFHMGLSAHCVLFTHNLGAAIKRAHLGKTFQAP